MSEPRKITHLWEVEVPCFGIAVKPSYRVLDMQDNTAQ